MAKIRVHALAKELGISSSDLLKVLEKINIQAKSNLSSLDEEEVSKVKKAIKSEKQPTKSKSTQGKKTSAKDGQAKKTIDQPKKNKEKTP